MDLNRFDYEDYVLDRRLGFVDPNRGTGYQCLNWKELGWGGYQEKSDILRIDSLPEGPFEGTNPNDVDLP